MTQKDKTGSLYKKEKTSVNPRLPTFTLYMNFQTHIDRNRMKSSLLSSETRRNRLKILNLLELYV
jgi:hypothetical protein